MTENGKAAISYMTRFPAALARDLGYRDMRDDLHGLWMRRMIAESGDMTLQAHRGSYKTTCLGVVIAILLATEPEKNILFMRKTDPDVIEVLKQVQRNVEHPQFRRLTSWIYARTDKKPAAPLQIVKATMNEITTDAYGAMTGASQLLGMGIGGSLTGKHADIIITDDIVNRLDRTSRAERERTKAIYQELQNVKNRSGRILNTGTPWHKEDAFSLMPQPMRYDCYSTGLIAPKKLEELRASMSPSLFAANYELRHIAAEGALFKTYPKTEYDPLLLRDGVAHIDAAYGGEDYTALTCARRKGDTIYLYGRIWHAHVDTVLDAALGECERLMCAPVSCEDNADKGYLAKEIKKRGGTPRRYTEKMNKYVKISTYLQKWWKNIVLIDGTDPEYVAQIMDYTEDAEHDDAPDSAACICRLLDTRTQDERYTSPFGAMRRG